MPCAEGPTPSSQRTSITSWLTDTEGNLIEAVLWRVPVAPSYPEGIRYRLVWIRRGEEQPTVLYDNHAPKGHHRHVEGQEEAYEFLDPDRLRADFLRDVSRLRGGRR